MERSEKELASLKKEGETLQKVKTTEIWPIFLKLEF